MQFFISFIIYLYLIEFNYLKKLQMFLHNILKYNWK